MDSKQRKKEQYRKARELGMSSKDASKYRSYSEKTFKDVYKKDKANKARRDKYKEAREKGLTSEQAKKFRSRKAETVKNTTREKADKETEFLLIGYREYTHGFDPEAYYNIKEGKRPASRRELNANIIQALKEGNTTGYIGDHKIDIVMGYEELKRAKMLYMEMDYIPVYAGEGKELNPLLTVIGIMTATMYPNQIKALVYDIIQNLKMMKSKQAQKNAEYLNTHLMDFIKGEDTI